MDRLKKEINININSDNEKCVTSNPIFKIANNDLFEKLSKKCDEITQLKDKNLKEQEFSELVDYINSLEQKKLSALFINQNELIRNIAAKAYVDNHSEDCVLSGLKNMLSSKNEYLRHSATVAISYMNSIDCIEDLKKASSDTSELVKITALAGLADIIHEHSSQEAQSHLEKFKNDENETIKIFVKDELSLL